MEENQIWLRNTRALAVISVIVLHVAAPFLNKYGEISDYYWHVANLYDSSVRFSVPVFFMISGALLLNRDYKLIEFLQKRLLRLIPPFIFWSLIYIVYDTLVIGEQSYTIMEFVLTTIKSLFYGSKFHLWFVYTIIGIYLFTPILRKWIKNSSQKEILYFITIWFISILYGIPILRGYLPPIVLSNFAGFIGYFVLGYYLSDLNLNITFWKRTNPIIEEFGRLIEI